MRCIHKILLVLLWLPLPLKAQRIPINANLTPVQMFEKAQMMLSNGYTDKGLGYLQMSAGKHYLPALKFLAQCYLEGKYVPKDFQEAGNILVMTKAGCGDRRRRAAGGSGPRAGAGGIRRLRGRTGGPCGLHFAAAATG